MATPQRQLIRSLIKVIIEAPKSAWIVGDSIHGQSTAGVESGDHHPTEEVRKRLIAPG